MACDGVRARAAAGLASLVLASTCASLPAFAAETRRLKESLPADVQKTIDEHEAAGTTDDEAYSEATMAYVTRWICGLTYPGRPRHALHEQPRRGRVPNHAGPRVERDGRPSDWEVTERLGELDMPVLVTSGRHDEMTETLVKPLGRLRPRRRMVVFENSAHFAPVEEPDRYRDVLTASSIKWKRRLRDPGQRCATGGARRGMTASRSGSRDEDQHL